MSLGHGALLALALAALGGCSPGYDHLELDPDGATVPGEQLSPEAVVLPVGVAVAVLVTPMSSDGPLGGDFSFNLTSNDASVLGVEPALGQTPGPAEVVFFGVSVGETEIDVTVNGQPEAPIHAQVTPQ
jgi:hypothetical protein